MTDIPATDTAAPADSTPYAGLTPHAVLDALHAAGLRGDGRLLQLNSYENRVFQVNLEDGNVVVAKFYRPQRWSDAQILEEHAFAHELAGAEIPVVAPLVLGPGPAPEPGGLPAAQLLGTPPTLARWGPWRFGVWPRCGGRTPELEQAGTLEWIGRFLGRLHSVGAQRSFEHRNAKVGVQAARQARDWLAEQPLLDEPQRSTWLATADAALARAEALFRQVPQVRVLRLHGDCHIGNLLWTRTGPHFVDLDDACTGPAVQDLWMLLSGSRDEMAQQLRQLLAGYTAMRSFDLRELVLIEALRTLRILQHSVWIARRWADPAFPVAFPGFASPAYWQQQAMLLREQLAAMDEGPLMD
jgi:Ser/Thr protein kinase RdoA (MazF antagonist)